VKPGDLVAWTQYAEDWSDGPDAGSYAGIVTRVIAPKPKRRSRARVEILDEEGTYIVGRRNIEVISES
jgi:hypothetical protein